MKKYFLDTNVILRFLLADVPLQTETAKRCFLRAKAKKIKLIVASEVILEAVYVLEKLYRVPREKIADFVGGLIKTSYLLVEKKEVLISTLEQFGEKNLDYVDLLLANQAVAAKAGIITFDHKLKKLTG